MLDGGPGIGDSSDSVVYHRITCTDRRSRDGPSANEPAARGGWSVSALDRDRRLLCHAAVLRGAAVGPCARVDAAPLVFVGTGHAVHLPARWAAGPFDDSSRAAGPARAARRRLDGGHHRPSPGGAPDARKRPAR